MSLAQDSGLILSARVGKHPDKFLAELIDNTAGKTDCKLWYTDGWAGYARVFRAEVTHIVGKENTQRLERTNVASFDSKRVDGIDAKTSLASFGIKQK